MKKSIIFIFVLAFTILMLPQAVKAARNNHFLGIGLGWNIYNKDDVTSLGNAWVYNWTVPGDSGNNPYSDFGNNYVPMVFGCKANSSEIVKTWIDDNSYSGPVLFLNEPDNGSANGGSACTPGNAVNSLSQFIQWKKDNNKNIDIIFGGVFFGPDMNWARVYPNNRFWLEEFYSQWKARYSTNPDIAGIHFHIYPWYPDDVKKPFPSYLSKESLVAHMKRRWTGGHDPLYNQNFIGWKQWLDNPTNSWALGTKNEIWITETGILHERVPYESVEYIMNQIIPFFDNDSTIIRVAWFSHAINPNWNSFDQTSLMLGPTRTPRWDTFKSLCTDGQYCKTSGGGNPSPTPPRVTATRTPTPPRVTATRTPTPPRVTATRTPTPPRVTATRTPTPPRVTATRTPTPPRVTATRTPTPPRVTATRTPTPPRVTATRTPTPPRVTATRTPTPPSENNTVRLNAVEDAHVRSSSPTANYGSASKLEVDASNNQPTDIAYIKFDITQLKGKTLKNAILKVKVANSSSDTQMVYYALNANWSQNTITYTNSRSLTMTRVASITKAQSGQIKEINVLGSFSGASTANTITFIISSTQSDGMDVYSREGGTAPVLEIIY